MRNTESLARLIGTNIRRERLRRDLSQEKLSERIAKTTQYLSLLESGTRCGSISTYSAIASELGIPIGELFTETKEGADDSINEQGALNLICGCSRYELYVLEATLRAMREASALCGVAALRP